LTDSAASPSLLVALRTLFPALADAAPDTLARIVDHGIHRKVRAGTVMFDAHTPCAGFPLVLSGVVRVLQRYPNGREMPLYKVRPGESCLLSGSCLLGHADYSATGIAETDVELLVVPPADFHALIAGDDGVRLALAPLGLGLDLIFQKGRPLLGRGTTREVTFNNEPLGDLRVQLIRGDRIVADGDEIDVG